MEQVGLVGRGVDLASPTPRRGLSADVRADARTIPAPDFSAPLARRAPARHPTRPLSRPKPVPGKTEARPDPILQGVDDGSHFRPIELRAGHGRPSSPTSSPAHRSHVAAKLWFTLRAALRKFAGEFVRYTHRHAKRGSSRNTWATPSAPSRFIPGDRPLIARGVRVTCVCEAQLEFAGRPAQRGSHKFVR